MNEQTLNEFIAFFSDKIAEQMLLKLSPIDLAPSSQHNEVRYLKIEEVCERLGVSKPTVRNLMDEGKLNPIKIGPRGLLRFKESEITNFK